MPSALPRNPGRGLHYGGTPIETIKFLIKIEVLIKSIKSLNGECWPESEINGKLSLFPYMLQEGPCLGRPAVFRCPAHICLYLSVVVLAILG